MSVGTGPAQRHFDPATTAAPYCAELVFAALYRSDRRPHARWTSLIRMRLARQQLHARGQRLVEDVFEQLAATYLLDALEGRVPAEMAVGAWLHQRFVWDSYRAAERMVRSAGALALHDELAEDSVETHAPNDTVDLVAFSLLERRVGEIVAALPYAERTAVGVRILCGMNPEHAYEVLALPTGSRDRANHNQAFTAGIGKLRTTLRREGWGSRGRIAH
jgi:hypothetical protein